MEKKQTKKVKKIKVWGVIRKSDNELADWIFETKKKSLEIIGNSEKYQIVRIEIIIKN